MFDVLRTGGPYIRPLLPHRSNHNPYDTVVAEPPEVRSPGRGVEGTKGAVEAGEESGEEEVAEALFLFGPFPIKVISESEIVVKSVIILSLSCNFLKFLLCDFFRYSAKCVWYRISF